MSNLLSYTNPDGKRRVCNKRCYDSKSNHQNCKCICHGHNHGRGEASAKKLTAKNGDGWIKSEQIKENTVQTTIFDEGKA